MTDTKKKSLKKIARGIGFTAMWIGIVVIALLTVLNIFINTPAAVSIVNLKVDGLTIGRIRGVVPFYLSVSDIVYAKDAIDARIPRVTVTINPCALFVRTVSIRSFIVDSPKIVFDATYVPKKPVVPDDTSDTHKRSTAEAEKKPFKLPVIISVSKAQINNIQRCEVLTSQGRFAVEKISIDLSARVTKADLHGNDFSCTLSAPSGVMELPGRSPIPVEFMTSLAYHTDTSFQHSLMIGFTDALKQVQSFKIAYEVNGNIQDEFIDLISLTAEMNKQRTIEMSATVNKFSDMKKMALAVRTCFIDINIEELLRVVKSNFLPSLPASGTGHILFSGKGSPSEYRGDITLTDGAFTFGTIQTQGISVAIGIDGHNRDLLTEIRAHVKTIKETALAQTVHDFKLDLRVALTDYSNIRRIVLNECALSMYGGTLSLTGASDFMNNIDYTLTLRDFTYLKYFNIPLTSRITADLHVKGENPKSVTATTAFRMHDIDYRKDTLAVKIPLCELTGTAIIDLNREFVYCDEIRLNVGEKSTVFLNGYVEKWGNERINLDIQDSMIDIAEMQRFVNILQKFEVGGRIELSAEVRGTAKKPEVKGDITFADVIYGDPKTHMSAKGISGNVWYTFTMPKTSLVAELRCASVRMPGIAVDEVSVAMPYTYAPEEKGNGKLTTKYNLFVKRAAFNQYEWTDISASIAAYNKNVALSGLLVHFLDGQIGGDMTVDLETMTYSVALSGIDINLRKAAKKSGTSIFAFASKISGTKTDISGYFDITRIDKDVLDKLLISLDPDKKNPEIQGIRSKLNMVGVVPKNIRVRVENGYIDIIPEFTTRRSNFISIILGFFVGDVEVDPIRRIPLKAILKELNIEG